MQVCVHVHVHYMHVVHACCKFNIETCDMAWLIMFPCCCHVTDVPQEIRLEFNIMFLITALDF